MLSATLSGVPVLFRGGPLQALPLFLTPVLLLLCASSYCAMDARCVTFVLQLDTAAHMANGDCGYAFVVCALTTGVESS